jgi:hypothetical protein
MSKDKELDAFLSKVDEIGIYSNGHLNLILQAKKRKALLLFFTVGAPNLSAGRVLLSTNSTAT